MRAFAVVCLLALSGCASTSASTACPPLVEYSPEFTEAFRLQLAAENPDGTRVIPEGSPIAIYIIDQTQLRDQVRACQ